MGGARDPESGLIYTYMYIPSGKQRGNGKKYTYIYIHINGGFNQKLIYKSGVSITRFDYRRVYTYMYIIYVCIYIYIYTSCTGYVLLSIGSYINSLLWVSPILCWSLSPFLLFHKQPMLVGHRLGTLHRNFGAKIQVGKQAPCFKPTGKTFSSEFGG